MRRLIETGTRMQKALAGGDGELLYPSGNYDDDDYDAPAPMAAKAPGPATPPATPAQPNFSTYIRGATPFGEQIVEGLDNLLNTYGAAKRR